MSIAIRKILIGFAAIFLLLVVIVNIFYHRKHYGFPFDEDYPGPEIVIPNVREPLGKEIMQAAFDGNIEKVRKMLRLHPELKNTSDYYEYKGVKYNIWSPIPAHDKLGNPNIEYMGLLNVAMARSNKAMFSMLLEEHVPPDVPLGLRPLQWAMSKRDFWGHPDTWYFERLLDAGANMHDMPDSNGKIPPWDPWDISATYGSPSPMVGIILGDRMDYFQIMLQHHYQIDWEGGKEFRYAVNSHSYHIAEYLLDHGVNIFSVDPYVKNFTNDEISDGICPNAHGGGFVAQLLAEENSTETREEEAAFNRVKSKAIAKGFPCPAPSRPVVIKAVVSGQWPPAAARALGARAIDPVVLGEVRRCWKSDGTFDKKSCARR